MEVLAIDWKNIDSRFVRDDAYEGINAPKWVDFLAPEIPGDDDSFFCRPDCSHPKTLADFHWQTSSPKLKLFQHTRPTRASILRSSSSSETTPLKELNERQPGSTNRALVSSSVASLSELKSPRNTKTPSKSLFFEAESENRNPNSSPSVNSLKNGKFPNEFRAGKPVQRQNLVQRPVNKESKSEMPVHAPEPETPNKAPPLKSSHSARNLFAGRDILNQISEFCTELKKLALNGNRTVGPMKPDTAKLKTPVKSWVSSKDSSAPGNARAAADEDQRKALNSRILSPDSWKKRKDKGENSSTASSNNNRNSIKRGDGKVGGQKAEWKITGKVNGNSRSSSNGVRSSPPTPQKFPPHPSPLKPPRASPLKPSSNMEGRMKNFQELLPKEKMSSEGEVVHDNKMNISPIGERPLDVFWFLNPCSLSLHK